MNEEGKHVLTNTLVSNENIACEHRDNNIILEG